MLVAFKTAQTAILQDEDFEPCCHSQQKEHVLSVEIDSFATQLSADEYKDGIRRYLVKW